MPTLELGIEPGPESEPEPAPDRRPDCGGSPAQRGQSFACLSTRPMPSSGGATAANAAATGQPPPPPQSLPPPPPPSTQSGLRESAGGANANADPGARVPPGGGGGRVSAGGSDGGGGSGGRKGATKASAKAKASSSAKARAERGASVRFLPTDAAPRLRCVVGGVLPHVPDGANGVDAADAAAAHKLACAPAPSFCPLSGGHHSRRLDCARAGDAPSLSPQSAPQPAEQEQGLGDGKPDDENEVPASWVALAECDAHFPRQAWTTLMHTLVEHPERSSSYILRADLLAQVRPAVPPRASRLAQVVAAADDTDLETDSDADTEVCSDSPAHLLENEPCRTSGVEVPGFTLSETVYRRLLPRNPTLDQPLDQLCYFYDRPTSDGGEGLVVYVPLLPQGGTAEQIPWYHPKVRALAFRFLALPGGQALEDGTPSTGQLRVDAILFSPPLAGSMADEPASRLMRTSKALLDLQHKHALGIARSYVKRVHHDVLVPQAAFQDRYVALKQAHAPRLLANWKEATDPKKHVYEDLAIAAYLLELWRRTYPDTLTPPGGFIDLGCGNGLLVHLLRSEGVSGFGVDVRARQSWSYYETRARLPPDARDLRVLALDPPALVADSSGTALARLVPRNCFFIGNHADELTPWVPLLAAAAPGDKVAFINIPCCPWRLEGDRFGRTTFDVSPASVQAALARGAGAGAGDSIKQVGDARAAILLGPPTDEAQSEAVRDVRAPAQARTRNAAYLAYVSWLQLEAGWVVEKEPLRIPSTKNWALVGRARTATSSDSGEWTYQSRPATADPAAERTLVAGAAHTHKIKQEACRPDVLAHVQQLAAGMDSWTARQPEGNTARLAPTTAAATEHS